MPRKSKKKVEEIVEDFSHMSIEDNDPVPDTAPVPTPAPTLMPEQFLERRNLCHPFKRLLYQIKDYYCDYHEIDAEYQKQVGDTEGQFMVERFYSTADEMNAEYRKIAAAYRHDMWGVIEIIAEMYQCSPTPSFKTVFYFSIYHQDDDNHTDKMQKTIENVFA